ncbi:MAG: Na+/H+ antiporter subunit E [Desulfonatronovibrio sp.]
MNFNKSTPGTDKHSLSETRNMPDLFSGLNISTRTLAKGFIIRWIIFAVLWWGLTHGDMRQWALSVFFISAAAFVSIMLVPVQGISLKGMVRFIPFFGILSVQGGLDVAARALSPSMPLKTGKIEYSLQLHNPGPRVVFVWSVSLLPGTAGVDLTGKKLCIHVLDKNLSHEGRLRKLEERIAGIFKTEQQNQNS